MIDDKTFNTVAQWGHFAGGAAVVLAFVVIGHDRWYAGWGFLLVTVLAAGKEFWYDEKYETTEVRGSSKEDFIFYMIGASAASILAILFG